MSGVVLLLVRKLQELTANLDEQLAPLFLRGPLVRLRSRVLDRILDVLKRDETALIRGESVSASLWTKPRVRETGGSTHLLEKLHHELEERAPRLVPVADSFCCNTTQLF